MKPIVSIIIPCFNAELFLKDVLESILAQTMRDFEVIAVNDGSTDNTRSILEQYAQNYPTKIKIHCQENQGVAVAKNNGFLQAEGQYIKFLDADDTICPEALERGVSELEETGKDIFYSDWQYIRESDGEWKKGEVVQRHMEEIHENPTIALFTDFWAPPGNYLYKRSVVESVGRCRSDLPVIQDARFILDCALQGYEFVYRSEVLATYRVVESSFSRRHEERFFQDCLKSANEIKKLWIQEAESPQGSHKDALAKVYRFIARGCYRKYKSTFLEARKNLKDLDVGYFEKSNRKLNSIAFFLGSVVTEECSYWYRLIKKKMGV